MYDGIHQLRGHAGSLSGQNALQVLQGRKPAGVCRGVRHVPQRPTHACRTAFGFRTPTIVVEGSSPCVPLNNLLVRADNQPYHLQQGRVGTSQPNHVGPELSVHPGLVPAKHMCVTGLQQPRHLPRHKHQVNGQTSGGQQHCRCEMRGSAVQHQHHLVTASPRLQRGVQPPKCLLKQGVINPTALLADHVDVGGNFRL